MLQSNIILDRSIIVVTGVAGFIGANLTKKLLDDYPDCHIIGIDSITDYYNVKLKYERLETWMP